MKQMELVLEDEILTSVDVASRLGVDANTVSGWCSLGYFPDAYRINPRKRKSPWRIPKRNVLEFVDERRKQKGYFYMVPEPGASAN